MKARIKQALNKLLTFEKTPGRLAASCCLGMNIALSPFLGIQTFLVFPFSWLLGLRWAGVMAITYTVNNPFTMIPIVVMNYAVGHWVFERFLGLSLSAYNPSFMAWINSKIGPCINTYLGITELSFLTYILGGLLFSFALSWPFFFLFRSWFAKAIDKLQ
jgi:hypothetical protein